MELNNSRHLYISFPTVMSSFSVRVLPLLCICIAIIYCTGDLYRTTGTITKYTQGKMSFVITLDFHKFPFLLGCHADVLGLQEFVSMEISN